MTTNKLRMPCPRCNSRLVVATRVLARTLTCPGCHRRIRIPNIVPAKKNLPAIPARPIRPVMADPIPPSDTVPVEVHLPSQIGVIKSAISKDTADKTALIATGGGLVAIGVALTMWILTGGRRTS